MFQQELFELLVRKRPEAVMVRATLEQALPPSFVDEVFERVAERQHTRKLLFSTLVQLLSLVVCKARSAVNSAILAMKNVLPVKRRSVYDKLNATEPRIAEALLRESAARMAAVVDELDAPLPPLIPGYQTRILDGNHLAATDHRPQALRTVGGGALPGVALVVCDAERGLVDRVYLNEDGHAQERDLLIELLGEMGAGEVWIADRNFATAVFMLQTHVNGSRFIVRRHAANGRITEEGPWADAIEGPTGLIDERPAVIADEFGERLAVRVIRIRLKKPTRDGDRELELVSDLPAEISAATIAAAYRQRWRIETAFAELDRVFEGEIASLAQPRAALLAFTLALAAFNTLGVVQAALRKEHGAERIKQELSLFHLGESVQRAESALETCLEDDYWTGRFSTMTAQELAAALLHLAKHVDLEKLRKSPRGPKKPVPARKTPKKRPHFSTARILADHKAKKRRPSASKKSRQT